MVDQTNHRTKLPFCWLKREKTGDLFVRENKKGNLTKQEPTPNDKKEKRN